MKHPVAVGAHELVRRRRALGISQRELGERVGVKQPQVARWEAHAYRAASLERVDAVAMALGPQGETVPIAAEPAAYGTATALRPVRDLGEIAARLRGHSEKLRELEFVDIAVFGSFARGEQTPASDVDVLVEMRVIEGFRYIQAANRVEAIHVWRA